MTVIPQRFAKRPGCEQLLDGLIVADDLTGAADSAVPFATAGVPTRVLFAGNHDGEAPPDRAADGAGTRVLALDTDSRRLDPAAARDVVAAAATGAPDARFRMKKIDSMLRGNLGPETLALMETLGCEVAICAPAFPAADRQTRDGQQWASGRLVGDVAAAFAGMRTTNVPLQAVRDGSGEALLASAVAAGARVVVVDAVTQEDLRAIVGFGSAHDSVLWVGTGGLGAALADFVTPVLAPAGDAGSTDRVPGVDGPVVTVVGSATPVAAAQARGVVDMGAADVSVPVRALLGGIDDRDPWLRQVSAALRDGRDVLVRLSEGDSIVPGQGRGIVEALATALCPLLLLDPPGALVATGGETALALGRALGAHGLDVLAELAPGVVYSHLVGDIRLPVVTKAGAFGDPGTLARTLETLRPTTRHEGLR